MSERSPIYDQFPDVRIDVAPYRKRFHVRVAEERIADTRNGLLMLETDLDPVVYVPRADVDMERLERTDHRSICPFKGTASYWSIRAGDETREHAVWSYEDPLPEVEAIKDHLAFYPHLVDSSAIAVPRRKIPGKIGIVLAIGSIAIALFHYWVLEASGVAVIETRRPDGTTRSTHVWFIEQDGTLWLEAGTPTNGWYLDVLQDHALSFAVGDSTRSFAALPIHDSAARAKLRKHLRAKYGLRDWWIGIVFDTAGSIPVRLDAASLNQG